MLKKRYLLTFLLLGIAFQSCSDMFKKPLVIGHRGAMGHETENTLASVQKALDLGVDMIEIDVFRIRSGEIMVFHDVRVDRLTNGVGEIEKYNVVQAKNLKLEGDQRIPLLQEVLRLVDKKARLNIELKGVNTTDRVNFIIESYIENQGWKSDDFLISSFIWDELKQFRKINQEVPLAVLTEGNPLEAIPIAKELGAEAINPYYLTLNEEILNQIHEAGFKVYTWTVNDPEEISRMKKMGVDGIISDFPERLK